jgi:hypothetical protein
MHFSAEHLTLIIVALITGLISPLTVQLMQYFMRRGSEHKKRNLNQNEAIKKDELVTLKLKTLMEKYVCDRIWIAEFHNGGHTYSGKSFQRFSTTYEVVSDGVSSEALRGQNIPTSIFSGFFKQLESQTHIFCKDIKSRNHKRKEDDPTYYAMHSFFSQRGSSSFLCLQIKDIQGNFVGFLCLDGVIRHLDLSEEEIKLLVLASSNLAGYLEG